MKFTKDYLKKETEYTKPYLDAFYILPEGPEKEIIREKILSLREEFKKLYVPDCTTNEDATSNKP